MDRTARRSHVLQSGRLTMTDRRQDAYMAGQIAYRNGDGPLTNPHTPAPPGDLTLARLWRAGWHAAKRKHSAQL